MRFIYVIKSSLCLLVRLWNSGAPKVWICRQRPTLFPVNRAGYRASTLCDSLQDMAHALQTHTHTRSLVFKKLHTFMTGLYPSPSLTKTSYSFSELNLLKHLVHWGKKRYFGAVLNSWTRWLEYSTSSVFPWQQSACAISCTTKGWKSRHSNLKPFPCKQILSLGFTFKFPHLINSSTCAAAAAAAGAFSSMIYMMLSTS